jgi:hypothetical protein
VGVERTSSDLRKAPAGVSRTFCVKPDDAQLLALLESKIDRPSIARKLKRTVMAVSARLKILRAKTK